MTRGGVTSKMPDTELCPQTRGGVTNTPVPRLLTNTQRRSHQQDASGTTEAPLEQPSSMKTKGTMKTNEDHREGVTDETPLPNVEA